MIIEDHYLFDIEQFLEIKKVLTMADYFTDRVNEIGEPKAFYKFTTNQSNSLKTIAKNVVLGKDQFYERIEDIYLAYLFEGIEYEKTDSLL